MKSFTALELFESMKNGEVFLVVDVRNESDFNESHVEGPSDFEIINIPYFDFIEDEANCLAKVPTDIELKIICAKESSSVFVATILESHGYQNLSYLENGFQTWGDLLVPTRLHSNGYNLWQFIRPAKGSCSYALGHGNEMFIFDPSRNVEFYNEFAVANGMKISHVFETHLQADYISGGPQFEDVIYAVNDEDFSWAAYEYYSLADEEIFTLSGGYQVQVIHSPGHTPGSTTFIIDNKWMISGDTVFILSIGRPDLGGQVIEWAKQLYHTLKTKITVLPENLMTLPGHFSCWKREFNDGVIGKTFGEIIELNSNIYSIDNENTFVEFIKDNMQPQPEVYSEIRKVNVGVINPDSCKQKEMDIGKNQCAASAAQQ
jgi:glyoxylase-like metal-dependent hydrolase (beta-lactamase superfamily II)/rhodanese-related sulfurtransferase